MKTVDPASAATKEVFDLLLGGVGPRPIALVSTVSAAGDVNLSPFSFFNAFGANPPSIAFSPSRRLRDNTTKHTLENLRDVRECVVQAVTHAMVQQVSLASTEYPRGVDEFVKSGLTPLPSRLVRPPRVAQSPFQMECQVEQIIELGGKAASGNLVLCRVVLFHVDESIFTSGVIDPDKIDLVARMGGDFYARASGEAVFTVRKPVATRGIGYDQLPESFRTSEILSANNLGQLGNIEQIPSAADLESLRSSLEVVDADKHAFEQAEGAGDARLMLSHALARAATDQSEACRWCHRAARTALAADDILLAWGALLLAPGH